MASLRLVDVTNILTRIIFGSVIVLPLSVSNYDLSHQAGISLKYSKTSPPLAIFDDEKISIDFEDIEISNNKKELLQSNRLQTRKMAIKIARKFESLQKIAAKSIVPKKEVRFLSGLSIAKSSPNVVAVRAIPQGTIQLKAANIARPPQINTREVAAIFAAPEKTQKFVAELNPRLRDRVEEVENFDEILNDDYGTESFAQRAQRLVAEETKNDLAKDITTGVVSAPIANRKSYSQRMASARGSDTLSKNYANSGYRKFRKGTQSPNPTPQKEDLADSINDPKSEEKGTVIASRGSQRQVVIAGNIEMTKGLAFTGNQQLIVYRQIGGTRYGYGQVMLEKGKYEILVEDPNTGVVIAELLDGDNMIGRAEVLMPEVMLNAKKDEDLKNIPIKLEPVLDQVAAENISAYSYYKKERLKNSQIRIGDSIDANRKIFNSTVILKTSVQNHWGNIILGSSKQVFKNILNPDATIKALKEILGVQLDKEEMGVIKGEISIAGQPVSGVEVELAGAGQEGLKPVYFNSFIPDASLKETTQNGQYAFVGLPEGNYLVRAKYKGKYLSPQVAPVEPGHVTQVQFDVQKPSLAEAFVFDIQSSEMMSAQINFLGSEQKVPIQSRKLISFSGSNGIQFLEAEAENYYTTRMTVDKSEKEILIPMISTEWLTNLISRLRINSIPDTGLIIGTATELPYKVELDPNAYNEDTRIVYFDSQGRLLQGATEVPSGGGFVAINVNQGIRSLFNRYHGTQNLKITTMAVDSNAINVFTTKF